MIYPPVQAFGLVILIAALLLFVYWGYYNPPYRLWLVPLLAWLFHGVVFYCWTVVASAKGELVGNIIFYTDWSAVVRLQGYLAMFAYALALIIWYPGDRHEQRTS